MTAGVGWGAVGVLCFSGTAPATRVASDSCGRSPGVLRPDAASQARATEVVLPRLRAIAGR